MNIEKKETLHAGSSEVRRFLQFSLGTEEYAIPLLSVKEVIAYPDITRIPYTPPHFLGIMNLRGQVISIVDLRLKLGMKAEKNSDTAVIICDLAPLCLGIVVNSVNSVLSLRQEDIGVKPEIECNRNSDYITGVTKKDTKLVLLLDIEQALDVKDHAALKQAAQVQRAA